MRKIEKIFQLLDSQNIKPATFERENDLGNGYLKKVKESGSDITNKMLQRIEKKSKNFYGDLMGIGNVVEPPLVEEVKKEESISVQSLSRSIELDAEARKINAESRLIEAKNIERLVSLLEGRISSDQPQTSGQQPPRQEKEPLRKTEKLPIRSRLMPQDNTEAVGK